MRTLKEIKALYAPKAQKEDDKTQTAGLQIKSADEKRFADKHVIKKIADRNGNGDDVFNATNVKGVERTPKHGYNPGEDEKVYEEVEDIKEYEQHKYVDSSGQGWKTDDDGNKERSWPSNRPYYGGNEPYRPRRTYFAPGYKDGDKPHAVHIDGKKWKEFGSLSHARNVAAKIGSKATIHPVKEEVEQVEESKLTLGNRIAWQHSKDVGLDGPKEMLKRHRGMDTNTLKSLSNKGPVRTDNSPAGLQQRIIKHELKKRTQEEVEQADEGYVSLAQQRAVWATRKDGGKGHPDNKKKKMKEEVELDEGDVIPFPGKMKEKPDTAPGWMLRKSPELAKKLKDAQDRVKKRKEIKEASKAPMDPEKKAKKAIDDILKMHEDPPSEKGMKIGEAKETESVPFEGPYDKPAKKQPGQKSDPGLSTVRHLARQAMQKMIDKTKKEEVEYFNEVLKPSMGAGAYISDFVHSKNPKFAGKSKKERMQQALAAYYAAKRGEK